MRISLSWLRELIDAPDADEVGEKLTMAGLAVDAVEATDDGDTILELDITANRGDCLSHLGVAREVAALCDLKVRLPETGVEEQGPTASDAVRIDIADPDLCRRYCGRYIEGIRVGPSPEWMARRLEAVGIRPVNNIADITNYVLMELGQPLHAFDADKLSGKAIVVRRARAEENLVTLDGQERRLGPSTLVIADAERPVALAGIMGGEESEITAATHDILIESAWFDPMSVRRTARRMNIGTEASYRFERGTDVGMAGLACDRAAQLVQTLAGGRVAPGLIDVYPRPDSPRTVHLRQGRIRAHLGMEVPGEDVVGILTRLGFQVHQTTGGWDVVAPSHRHDVAIEEDLLEEIARHYGYDRFPSTLPATTGSGRRLPFHAAESELRDLMSATGYTETCSLVFSSREIEEGFAPGVEPVVIRNPLSEEQPVLRTSLVPSMLETLRWNLNRGSRDLQFYEIGKVYPRKGEHRRLVMAATGALRPQTPHGAAIEAGFFQLKGDVEALLGRFDIEVPAPADGLPDHYHPGRAMRLGPLAVMGELAPAVQEDFRLRQKVYLAEIDVEALYEAGLRKIAASRVPKYPAVRRDLSLLLDRRTRYAELVRAIEAARIDELIRIEPFDRLESGPFPESVYSLGVGLVYQAADRTLTDEEIRDLDDRVLAELDKIGVKLRT